METVNQGQNTQQSQEPENKTFTQAEVDAIIGDRLQRERSKYADYSQLKEKADLYDQYTEASKSELQKANEKAAALQKELDGLKKAEAVRNIREKISKETGVPSTLLTGDTEESCKAQAEAIKAYAKPAGYPSVPDGGEPQGQRTHSTAQQFADWFKNVQK